MGKKQTKYVMLHGSTLKEGLLRETFVFTTAELQRAAKRYRKMEAKAEKKVAPFMVGKYVELGRLPKVRRR